MTSAHPPTKQSQKLHPRNLEAKREKKFSLGKKTKTPNNNLRYSQYKQDKLVLH